MIKLFMEQSILINGENRQKLLVDEFDQNWFSKRETS